MRNSFVILKKLKRLNKFLLLSQFFLKVKRLNNIYYVCLNILMYPFKYFATRVILLIHLINYCIEISM
jgi:hypothetical protein